MMQTHRRAGQGGPRAAAEPKAPAGRRDLDVNRERLIFCMASLVGHKVTAKLRNNVIYEGIFHSCSLDGDYSITLKAARQIPSGSTKSGEVLRTLIISGKDFLQISATEVPPPAGLQEVSSVETGARGFATDAEIAQARGLRGDSGGRELISWQPAPGEADPGISGSLGDPRTLANWDQFQANEQMWNIRSTYSEELYTTKLDPSSIPREKREEAERIAREIESGRMNSEVEGCLEGEGDDEELAFSAVPGTGAYRRKDLAVSSSATGSGKGREGRGGGRGSGGPASLSDLPTVPHAGGAGFQPLTKGALDQHEALSGAAGDSYAREHRAKRGMITAHSPMRSPMISEMKRINALNLEPALPKLDDKTRNDWINFKQSQTRTSAKSAQGVALKSEFQQSLELIQRRAASKQAAAAANGADSWRSGGATGTAAAASATPKADGGELSRFGGGGAGGGDTGRSKGFSFNPAAKEFSFNPAAASFTPTGAMTSTASAPSGQAKATPAQPMQASASASNAPVATQGSGPLFVAGKTNAEIKTLHDVLDRFLDRATGDRPEVCTPDWPGATGPKFQEVLGQPNAQSRMGPMAMGPGGCQGGPGGCAWQPAQGQMAPQGGPVPGPGGAMVQGAFLMPAGAGQQMGYPQMYSGQGGPRPQGQGGMPQGGGQPQQGQGQGMVFQQGGCQGGQGTGGAIGAMPKFGGPAGMVPVIMQGQFGPQGFVPQQAMQGQGPGQQMGGGQPGQMMSPGQMMPQGGMMQGPMMQPNAFHMQRGGHMGGPGQGHQMGGHDG